MKRRASEIIRNLESRIARLERQANTTPTRSASASADALIDLGSRARRDMNHAIFKFLKENSETKYVGVDVEDTAHFYDQIGDTYLKLYVELEYIDEAGFEKVEKATFKYELDRTQIDRNGKYYDEMSIWRAATPADSDNLIKLG
jgi:hypothetical protein